MKNWFTVFLYELLRQFRSKSYLFMTFGVPVLAIAAFLGYQAIKDATGSEDSDDGQKAIEEITNPAEGDIGYVDLTPEKLFPQPASYSADGNDCAPADQAEADLFRLGQLTRDQRDQRAELIKRITSPYCLRDLVHAYDTQAAGEKALDDGLIEALYVIDPTYATTGKLSVYISNFSMEGQNYDNLMQGYVLSSLLYDVDPATYERLYLRLREPAIITEHQLGNSGTTDSSNENQNFVLVYAFGIMMMLSLFWGGGYLMQSVVQEKESRIIEIILSSVRPLPLLTGKILAMGALSILQIATLIGAFVFIGSQAGSVIESLGDLEISTQVLIVMPIYFVLGFLLFGSLMAAIGAVTNSMRESQNFVAVVTLPAAMPFFFLTMFVEEPNGTLARVFSIFPFTAPLSMIMRASVVDVPAGELILSLVLLTISVIGVVWLSGRLFRVNILLMGNTPKLRDIPKLLRG